MYCSKCGNMTNKNASFCDSCGTRLQNHELLYKPTQKSKTFYGRHQQFNFIRNLLGEEITDKNSLLAIKKDYSEYKKIFDGLESIKLFIQSNGGNLNDNKVAIKVGQDIEALVTEGYRSCVLQNNPDLEIACFKIYDDYDNRVLESVKQQNINIEKISHDLNEIRLAFSSQRYMDYQQFGDTDDDIAGLLFSGEEKYKTGKLITSPYQKAWWIIDAISPVNRWSENPLSMIAQGIALYYLVSKDDKALLFTEDILSFAKLLANNGKINPDYVEMVIEREIKLGEMYRKNKK